MSEPMETIHDRPGVVRLARRAAPHLRVLSASEATLRSWNIIGFIPSTEVARDVVLELESMSDDDGDVGQPDSSIGLVVMGTGASEHAGVDPEGVSRWISSSVVAGVLLGGAVGAVASAGLAALFDAPIAAAAIGGGFLLAVIVAIWLTFARLGGSDAYRQTFVDPHVSELTVVSFHTNDHDRAGEAFERLRQRPGITSKLFDESLSRELRR